MIDSAKYFGGQEVFEKDTKILKKVDRPPISKNLLVESSTEFYLIHEYLRYLFDNSDKDMNAKTREIEAFANILSPNIMERISEDFLGKFKDKLEIVKFLCKDFWMYLFGKIVDRLQTDSKGRYVIVDTDFKFLRRIPGNTDSAKEYSSFCAKFIAFLIKSALMAFQLETEVTVETSNNIEYSFNIFCKVKQTYAMI